MFEAADAGKGGFLPGILFIAAAVLLTPFYLAALLYKNQDLMLIAMSHQITIAPCVAIGIGLYRLRGNNPTVYGIGEVLVSLVTILFSIASAANGLLATSLGLLGGIYVMVRGLDNIDKGLPPSWRTSWDKWFPKRIA